MVHTKFKNCCLPKANNQIGNHLNDFNMKLNALRTKHDVMNRVSIDIDHTIICIRVGPHACNTINLS